MALASFGLPGQLAAQSVPEAQLHALGIATARTFFGGGAGIAIRPRGRLRLALTGTAGRSEGRVAGRVEVVATFSVTRAGRGLGVYGGGGAAVTWRSGERREWMLLVVGIESSPARSAGWFLEGGVGGGLRAAAGIRLRKPPARS